MEKSNGEIKDMVLRFLLKEHVGHSIDTIYKELGKPTRTLAQFEKLIEEMDKEGEQYFTLDGDGFFLFISKNELTQEFLNGGGFTRASEIAAANTAANTAAIIKEQQEKKEAKRITREKNREQLTLVKFQKKTFWIPTIISILSTLIAGGALYWSIYNGSDNVSQEQAGTMIDSIQNRLQSLENSIKQTSTSIVNDSIQIKE